MKNGHRNPAAKTIILLLLVLAGFAHAEPERRLTMISWANYLDPSIIADFEARENVEVVQIYAESDIMRNNTLAESDGRGFDVAFVDGTALAHYRRLDWILPLSTDDVPNLTHIDAKWHDPYPDSIDYSIPFAWGTTGIAYRSDLVPGPITSWKDLLQPHSELCGKIMMQGEFGDNLDYALHSLDHSAPASLEVYQQVERLLLEQRDCVGAYGYLELGDSSELLSGEIWAATIFNGDAVGLRTYSPHIEYVNPVEGSELWIDFIVGLQHSRNKDLVWKFLDFLCDPEIATRQALYGNYATTNKAAAQRLPASFIDNPLIYPSDDIIRAMTWDSDYDVAETRLRNQISSRIHHQ